MDHSHRLPNFYEDSPAQAQAQPTHAQSQAPSDSPSDFSYEHIRLAHQQIMDMGAAIGQAIVTVPPTPLQRGARDEGKGDGERDERSYRTIANQT